MQERGRGSRGSGGGGAGVAGPNSSHGGWPLGLQPLHMHIQMLNVMSRAARSRELPPTSFSFMSTHHPPHHQLHYLQGEVSPFFLSTYTPSISSLSSSDLDTESTGSFFPERSTTLGTLIGIHSRSQRNQPTVMDNVLLQSKHMTKAQKLHACWCAFTLIMRCSCSNSGVNPSQESLSPYSLAHLLELERKAAHTQLPQEEDTLQCETLEGDYAFEGLNGPCSHQYPKDLALLGGVGECSHPQSSTNTLFNDDGILPPDPAGAPSKVTFRQFSSPPTASSYISTDWSAGVPIVRKRKHYPSSHNRLHGSLCPGFWKLG